MPCALCRVRHTAKPLPCAYRALPCALAHGKAAVSRSAADHLFQHRSPRLHRHLTRYSYDRHALCQALAGVLLEKAGRDGGRRSQRGETRHFHGKAAGAARRATAAGAPLLGRLYVIHP